LSDPLPNANRAIVQIEKLRDYCLNPEHEIGKNKARVFKSALGLTREDAAELGAAVLQAAQNGKVRLDEKDEWGQRYEIVFKMRRGTREAFVCSAWIIRAEEDFPRLTSCYIVEDVE
jgi:hypothetical protein